MAFIRRGWKASKKRVSYSELYKKAMGKQPLAEPSAKPKFPQKKSGCCKKSTCSISSKRG